MEDASRYDAEQGTPDYLGRLSLRGRRAVVLGAGGRGIGRQVSHALAQAGAELVCVDQTEDAARAIGDEVGGRWLVADVTDRAQLEGAFDAADELLGAPLDVLVDIVGVSAFDPLLEMTDATWDAGHDLVLRHVFRALQLAGRRMAEGGGGSMVFIGSSSGLTASPLHAAYGAMKAGLMQLVKTGAQELGSRGIRVNAVAPGPIWTHRVATLLGPDQRRALDERTPLGSIGVASDVASVILFLCSDLARHVSGQTIAVDGGALISTPFPDPD